MNKFLKHTNIKIPIICGPMYPCGNPELIASVSNSGAIGIVQPLTLTYVNKYTLTDGIKYIRTKTNHAIGFNALIEKSSKKYENKMKEWVDIALQENIRFFITSLGNPSWVVEKVHSYGGIVYHDVTNKKWAQIAINAKVDGLIAVNNKAGGHAGNLSPKELLEELKVFDLPIICAGGVGDRQTYKQMLELGYDGVQMGTRFIASDECDVSLDYKQAIVSSNENNIILTKHLTGVPVSIISKEQKSSRVLDYLLSLKYLKHFIRIVLTLFSLSKLKKDMKKNKNDNSIWQAGKSVKGISSILSVKDIITSFKD